MNWKIRLCLFVCALLLLGITGCSNNESNSAIEMPTAAVVPSDAIAPSATTAPTEMPTPMPTAIPDLGSALISPADSIDFFMAYGPMDTWVDDDGMHAAYEYFYRDFPGVSMAIDCGVAPNTELTKDLSYMTEIPVAFTYGEETKAYRHKDNVYLYFLDENCRVEILVKPFNTQEEDLYEKGMQQIYGMAEIIENRLQEVQTDGGLQMPSLEIVPGLEEETFLDIEVWHWGETFRSYSVALDTKKKFIEKSTFAIYDRDQEAFIFRRDVPNFPPLGESTLDNLGETVSVEGPVKTMSWEGNYDLWIWVEDELVGVYPLEPYEEIFPE